MSERLVRTAVLAAAVVAAVAVSAFAAEESVHEGDVGTADKADLSRVRPAQPPYSPYAGRNFPTRPFFGDTHLHTGFSFDAGAFGARLKPRDAYLFARGGEIRSNTGQPVKLPRPLDFLLVADHSDNMGWFLDLLAGKPNLLADPTGRRWYDMIQAGKGNEAAFEIISAFSTGKLPPALVYAPGTAPYRNAWQETVRAAEEANEPGRVIEIPTPRWTVYDAKRLGVKPLEGTRMTLQERAYTSPIWYTP